MAEAVVLFGATGDLSRRKVLPALANLIRTKQFANDVKIIGLATRKLDQEQFFDYVKAEDVIKPHLEYMSGNFNEVETYERLKEKVKKYKKVIYYLATPPSFYTTIISFLGSQSIAGKGKLNAQNRIVVEKPFGINEESARGLNEKALEFFSEDQIYRIDHYLGKETVQNISAFRFSNGIFESLWNRQHIDYITITVAENIGVENRGKYFEESGTLRDIVQNHLFQLLALIAMEPPVEFKADYVRDEKVKVFKSIKPIHPDQVVRGQYVGYRNEENVDPDSNVETFVALKTYVDNWRWAGVPFYLRTGKTLPERTTEIVISFHNPPTRMFNQYQGDVCSKPNQLIFKIQPEQSIAIQFGVKQPGRGMDMMPVNMVFNYSDQFAAQPLSDYERLILDCYNGDLTLFARKDGVESCWRIVDAIQDAWKKDPETLSFYAPKTWGPRETKQLFTDPCHHW